MKKAVLNVSNAFDAIIACTSLLRCRSTNIL